MKKLLSILKWPFVFLATEFNTVLNSIVFYVICKRATRRYNKTKIHRFVVPMKKHRLGIITGADLRVYNKITIKRGLKKIRYNKLKREAYFTTDTLKLKPHLEKLQLSCVLST